MEINNYILEIKNLSKKFPGVKALDNINLKIRKGDVHALLGENGAGKSTLIKIIAGVYTNDEGTIFLNNEVCQFSSPSDAFKKGLSVIHQETSLVPELTVVQNIFLGIEDLKSVFKTLDSHNMYVRYREICDKINFHIKPDLQVKELSVAEKKIIEIIKALIRNASLIIMDEPTDSLTGKEIEHLYSIIRDLKNQDVTIIYITHYMNEVFDITDRATVMKDGKHILTEDTSKLTPEKIISAMVGKEIYKNTASGSSGKSGSVAIEVKNLSSINKFHQIGFKARYGEILGITGVIGSGKTELVRAIFGADSYDSGEILVNNCTIKQNNPNHALKNGIGMIPEDRKTDGLFLDQEVYKNLTLSFIEKNRKPVLLSKKTEAWYSKKMIEKLNIKVSGLDHKVKFLSGGNQQKVVIAKWLLADPDIIILDEPTRGIDVGAKGEIHRIMHQLSGEGKCIIFISSEIPEITTVSDTILLMKNGRIVNNYKKGISQKELFHAMLEVNA